MTMVHFATTPISRNEGRSAVACAAYRAADILYDVRYGKTHDYRKKKGVLSSHIVLPSSLKAAGAVVNRETLWNLAEAAEKRKDSRVAREWLVNLPYQLSEEERQELALEFAQNLCDDMDVIADVCIHKPVMKLPFDPNAKPSSNRLREGEKNPDPRNYHAHILVTTRSARLDKDLNLEFDSLKIPFEWSNKKRRAHGLAISDTEIARMRHVFVNTANKYLAANNLPLMDARSFEDQGLDQQPTIKMGVEATAMERRGIKTEKGNFNRAVKARNQAVIEHDLQQRIENEKRDQGLRRGIDWAAKQNEKLYELIGGSNPADEYVESTERCIKKAQSGIEWASERCKKLPTGISAASGLHSLSKRRVASADRWFIAVSQETGRVKSIVEDVYQGIEEREKPAPTPFDGAYQRAFFERKRQINREFNAADQQADKRKYGDARISSNNRQAKKVLADRLMTCHDPENRLRHDLKERSVDYPDKFDYRQIAILNKFAQSLELHKVRHDRFTDRLDHVTDLLTLDVMNENLPALDILIDKKRERQRYETITQDFYQFLKQIDASRAVTNTRLQQQLGRSDISRMTAETQSAPSYLSHIVNYLNKDGLAEECKKLAEAQIAKTLAKTCLQYNLSYQELHTLRSQDSVQKHLNALKSSLAEITENYQDKLTEGDITNINKGLAVIKQEVIIQDISSPSLGF